MNEFAAHETVMTGRTKVIIACIVSVVVLLVLAFGWPTLYRYDTMKLGTTELLVRTNRITGESEVLAPGKGWVPQGQRE